MFGDSVQIRVTGSVGAYLTCYAYASPYAHVYLASLPTPPPRYSTHHEQLDRTLLEEQRCGGNQEERAEVRKWHFWARQNGIGAEYGRQRNLELL